MGIELLEGDNASAAGNVGEGAASSTNPPPQAGAGATGAQAAAQAASQGAAPTPPSVLASALPDDLKENPSLNRYSSVEALARGYLNAERLISSEKVPVPKDEQDQEAWERYYKAGGKPEAPDKYEFRKPESLPEGVTYDDGMEVWWRQSAHEAGLNKKQAAKLYDKYAERFFAQLDLQNRSVGDEVRKGKLELQRDWGNEYEFRRQMATAEFNDMPDTLKAHLTQVGLTRNASFIKYLADARSRVTGEVEAKGGQSPNGMLSPQMVQQKIADFRSTHATALSNAAHPEHRLRLEEMTRLYQALYPDKPNE